MLTRGTWDGGAGMWVTKDDERERQEEEDLDEFIESVDAMENDECVGEGLVHSG